MPLWQSSFVAEPLQHAAQNAQRVKATRRLEEQNHVDWFPSFTASRGRFHRRIEWAVPGTRQDVPGFERSSLIRIHGASSLLA
mmetsp:Transcript_17306/g.55095  ORF Transcript_17306/g.55095 Transcript_17306/m.55095 type:complete len:83 (+) Transcript_17306:255-503(+)